MARKIGEAFVAVRPDTEGFKTEADSKLKAGLVGVMKAIGVAAAAAFTGAVAIGIKSVAAARDLAETQSAVGVIFGQSADKVREFGAAAASSLGQSQIAALGAANTFATFGKSAGLSGDKLVGFSTQMTTLASDLASFKNTSPEEAILAIGAALRGETEPIRRYGVLLDDASLRQEAFRQGLIKSTKTALTPQQKVLAAHALILKQTSDAQGDFGRTSAGLANQQRIASAEIENLKARIGTALLPIVTQLVTVFNTKLIPVMNDLWTRHGPAVTAFFTDAADKVGPLVAKLGEIDFAAIARDITTALRELGPQLRELGPQLKEVGEAGGTGLTDTLSVAATAFKFLADHADLLAKALPYIVAALVLYKTAQAGANVAALASVPLRVAEVVATFGQRAALNAHTAALTANTAAARVHTVSTVAGTAAENVGILTRIRGVASIVAHRIAVVASAVASGIWTAANYVLGLSMWAALGPVGLIIAAIVVLIGIIVLIATKTDWFQRLWKVVWTAVKDFFLTAWDGIVIAAKAVANFFTNTLPEAFGRAKAMVLGIVTGIRDGIAERFRAMIAFARTVPDTIWEGFKSLAGKFAGLGRDIVAGIIQGIKDKAGDLFAKAADLASGALKAAKNAIGVGSPSKAFRRELGNQAGEGAILGVLDKLAPMRRAGERLARAGLTGAGAGAGGPGGGFALDSRRSFEERMLELLGRILRAVEAVAPGVGAELNGTSAGLVVKGRAV